MRERVICETAATCSSCGIESFVIYDEGNKIYCPQCAYKYGAISQDSLFDDYDDNYLHCVDGVMKKTGDFNE